MYQKIQESLFFSNPTKKNLEVWLKSPLCSEEERKKIYDLIETNPQEIENSFYTSLAFGTGGLRGLMGLGPNRMNSSTVRMTTEGIAEYVLSYYREQGNRKTPSAVIGYDSRKNSFEFASETAKVFKEAGFTVFLFADISPTPLVSFACRFFHASVAVLITASHNPPEYNGYKVYWSYGGQVLPPHDEGMMKAVERIRLKGKPSTESMRNDGTLHMIDATVDQAYFSALSKEVLWEKKERDDLHVIYSPLHGTGGRLMSGALALSGLSHMAYVEAQRKPDGSFPTVRKPNPEERAALKMGIDQLMADKADIFLASDPDADRLGVVVRHQDTFVTLTGNQIAALLCEWILRRKREKNLLKGRYGIIKSCVTTPLLDAIATRWNAIIEDVLPGFKYIAQKIEEWLELSDPITYIFGAEESYGTLYGLHARDKDALSSGAVVAEIAWHMKQENKTLIDALKELYTIYGYYYEDLLNIEYQETKEGREKMSAMLETLRSSPPKAFATHSVLAFQDLKTGVRLGDERHMLQGSFVPSDVLVFGLEGGSRVIIRPSGTEPKVKIYLFLYEASYTATSETSMVEKSNLFKEWFFKSYG